MTSNNAGLTQKELAIVSYVEKNATFSSYRTKAAQEEFVAFAISLGIETETTVWSKELFETVHKAVLVMYEGIEERFESVEVVTEEELLAEAEEEIAASYINEDDEPFEDDDDEDIAYEEADSFVNGAKEKMEAAASYIVKNVKSVGRILEEYNNFANMSDSEIEAVLMEKGSSIFTKIKDALTKHKENIENMKLFVGDVSYDEVNTHNALEIFKAILDNENLNGWGKFKAIVKTLVRLFLRFIIRAMQILLKIAVTVFVGVIKISAVTLGVAWKSGKIVKKDIADPVIDSVKGAYRSVKEKREEEADLA